ncbi:tyrosine--tRNA ligase [Facklamia sp. P13055]|uniref:tyrosine--tRNA ligase n=1 Tax=Facklamia sp. P13055 TaxID=3421952 RepID=UPI003D17BEEC
MNGKEILNSIRRYTHTIIGEENLIDMLDSKNITVKFGADPTRPDLHLGHSVILKVMKIFQNAGHSVIFVIGDYTAMIGDPSGKSKTRPSLTFKETRNNAQSYLDQVNKILDTSKTKVCYNSEWLEDLSFENIISMASKYTVSQILERDDFNNRFINEKPIGIHEILYPLVQGYDSVAIKSDVELGGVDQTFNLLVGRDMQKAYNQSPQCIITFPLLVGIDGKNKMSKSLDNYIGIDEEPGIMYEKAMKIPDSVLENYFRLTTDIPEEVYLKIMKEDIVKAHKFYSYEIVSMYHSSEEALKAQNRYENIAKGQVPDDILTLNINKDILPETVINILFLNKIISSKSEGKRLINQNGVSINGRKVTDVDETVESNKFKDRTFIIKIGKNRYFKFIID